MDNLDEWFKRLKNEYNKRGIELHGIKAEDYREHFERGLSVAEYMGLEKEIPVMDRETEIMQKVGDCLLALNERRNGNYTVIFRETNYVGDKQKTLEVILKSGF